MKRIEKQNGHEDGWRINCCGKKNKFSYYGYKCGYYGNKIVILKFHY